jgi:hypothetical protein
LIQTDSWDVWIPIPPDRSADADLENLNRRICEDEKENEGIDGPGDQFPNGKDARNKQQESNFREEGSKRVKNRACIEPL